MNQTVDCEPFSGWGATLDPGGQPCLTMARPGPPSDAQAEPGKSSRAQPEHGCDPSAAPAATPVQTPQPERPQCRDEGERAGPGRSRRRSPSTPPHPATTVPSPDHGGYRPSATVRIAPGRRSAPATGPASEASEARHPP